MSWNEKNELRFGVHLKENQSLKYLNADSQHTKATFKAIPSGVFRRLSSLTTITKENEDSRIDQVYPEHAKALTNARLVT